MKINELAGITGVNAQTIRKYRERGLLRPEQNPENGYYEYSDADFLNLLYIRKLRGANLSLDTIESTYRSGEAEALLAGYRETISALEEQIQELLQRRRMLLVSYRHYERDAADRSIRVIDAFGEKVDRYFARGVIDPVLADWVRRVELFTMVLYIEQRFFDSPSLPARVPVQLGLGTYTTLLKEHDLPIPEGCARFPEGRYASFFAELEELDSLPAAALEPIRTYLRDKRLRPLGGTTGYLYRADTSRGNLRFIFNLRLPVEEA